MLIPEGPGEMGTWGPGDMVPAWEPGDSAGVQVMKARKFGPLAALATSVKETEELVLCRPGTLQPCDPVSH